MMNFDMRVKYRGFSFDAGYYYRWLDKFGGSNLDSQGFSELKDDGFFVMAAYMVIPKMLRLSQHIIKYLATMEIRGEQEPGLIFIRGRTVSHGFVYSIFISIKVRSVVYHFHIL